MEKEVKYHQTQQISGVNSFLKRRNLDKNVVVDKYIEERLKITEDKTYAEKCEIIQDDFYTFHEWTKKTYPYNGS